MIDVVIRSMIHQAAASLSAGVVQNLPDTLPRSGDGTLLPEVQAENLLAWQIHKVFYSGIVRALDSNDAQAWPTPKSSLDLTAGLLAPLAPLLGKAGLSTDAIASLLETVMRKLAPDKPPAPTVPAGELK